jgi:hypothetical protein
MLTSAYDRIPAVTLTALLAWSVACGGSTPAQVPEQAAKSADSSAADAAAAKGTTMEDTPSTAAPNPLVGKAAPPIVLEGTGGAFDLEKARAEGPVLAVFYRGDW